MEKPEKDELSKIGEKFQQVELNGEEALETTVAVLDDEDEEELKPKKGKKKPPPSKKVSGTYLMRLDFFQQKHLSLGAEYVDAVETLFKNQNWLSFAQEVASFLGYVLWNLYIFFCWEIGFSEI